ncbi:hypothetical protein OQA88_8410 [Cercophora sp. LCS_1]
MDPNEAPLRGKKRVYDVAGKPKEEAQEEMVKLINKMAEHMQSVTRAVERLEANLAEMKTTIEEVGKTATTQYGQLKLAIGETRKDHKLFMGITKEALRNLDKQTAESIDEINENAAAIEGSLEATDALFQKFVNKTDEGMGRLRQGSLDNAEEIERLKLDMEQLKRELPKTSGAAGGIPSSGLTTVFDPSEPSIDIVFVHGFTGHPERTWTNKKGNRLDANANEEDDAAQPPSKTRKLNFLLQPGRCSPAHAVFWPRDLLPQSIPDARVLTYGYDTNIRHWIGPAASRSTIYDIAWDFLVTLEADRRSDPSRPLLFVVHSLGGIVIKEMLRRSSGCQLGQSHLHQVFESTTGIMFFGTPHSGADPLGFLRRTTELVATIAGFSVPQQIVNSLLPSSDRLRELRDEFVPMAHREGWFIHSFQEQQGLKALNGRKVVDDTSSYLNSPNVEITEHIARNHMDMYRFTGHDDVEYKKVVKALQRMASNVKDQGQTRRRRATAAQESALRENQAQMLLEVLRFDQIDSRQMSIKKAHAKSCKWFLTKSEYLHWLEAARVNEHHGFLWIKGKPGAGKSTFMKYIFANAKRTMGTAAVLSFFFNARGGTLERSTTGLFRSLIIQLLERIPETQRGLGDLNLPGLPTSIDHWSVETLKELFGHVVQMSKQNRPIICFIDALDECDEQEVRDMISYFEYLGELCVSSDIRFHVCFSSRHYPHITQRLGLSLVLEGQEGHNEDIASYLNTELRIGHSRIAEEVRAQVQEK